MPKRGDIKKVMIIGSGPIIIGQACEFDYSGTQACKALRRLGYEIVLVNSNPATIMTDPGMADITYIEPLNLETLTEIVEKEKPDALLPNLGGQTGLNLSLELARAGVLEKHGVKIIGVQVDAIERGEDRQAFKDTMAKLGIEVAKTTVEKYRVRPRGTPSPTWIAFLNNHVKDLVSIDFFTVPTVRFQVLFVFLVLAHHRRRVVHFNVTANPSSQWTAQQIVEAFPFDTAPRYLVRDRDDVYGTKFRNRVRSFGIEAVVRAPRSPWQNPYVERLIGSIRRECLDHVIVINDRHLKRLLTSYFQHYHSWRVHRSLDMDCPHPQPEIGRAHV